MSAEYILSHGNNRVILYGGIRVRDVHPEYAGHQCGAAAEAIEPSAVLVDPSHGTGHWGSWGRCRGQQSLRARTG